jgi:Asp-tRNA(Asn)/Glu-tRNA(Gln) amidotransferase A subunit family amidase
MIDPLKITAREIAFGVNSGKLSAQEVTEAYLDRIAQFEPSVRAFAWHDADFARKKAQAPGQGLLAGVPFGIKDVFDTADMPTGYGSEVYRGARPVSDASAVHLASRAGGVAMGKTVTTEFATSAPGPTCNPFDRSRTPGGSSSGSAAGLAAAFFPLAFGTQTSGSTVRPASYCGVVGYKASAGMLDRTGVKPLSGTLDIVGLMARDVRDCALFAAAIARREELVPADSVVSTLRVGLLADDLSDAPSSASIDVLEKAAGIIGDVVIQQQPGWWIGLGEAQADVFAWEASAALARERDLFWDILQPVSHTFLKRQDGITFERWRAGCAARDSALADLDRLFGDCDVLITQAAPGEAPIGLASTGPASYNIRWTLLGTPSLSLPAGLGPSGLPIGIQVVARPGQDAKLLAYAAAIEDRLRRAGTVARPDEMDFAHVA